MPDDDPVRETMRAFYEALERADFAAMSTLWATSPTTVCVHPGWPALVGTEAILESWRTIFRGGPSLRVRYETLTSHRNSGQIICLVNERLYPLTESAPGDEQQAIATNVLSRNALDRWQFVVHHASPAPTAKAPISAALH